MVEPPIWKICASQNGSWNPRDRGENKKYMSCHHLVIHKITKCFKRVTFLKASKHRSFSSFYLSPFPFQARRTDQEPTPMPLPIQNPLVWECYCWWKKSCTSWHVWNPVNNDHIYHINWWVYRILTINSMGFFRHGSFLGPTGPFPGSKFLRTKALPSFITCIDHCWPCYNVHSSAQVLGNFRARYHGDLTWRIIPLRIRG